MAAPSSLELKEKIKTFNQTYGCFDYKSPVFKHQLKSTSTLDLLQRVNPKIQFSDCTLIPPKKYAVDHYKEFYGRSFPTYPLDLVVPEDYQRVMKQYKIIEDQDELKRKSNSIHGIKEVSPKKMKEKELQNPDPLKLKKKEVPYVVLYKIDKMIRQKLNQIDPIFLQKFRRQQSQSEVNYKPPAQEVSSANNIKAEDQSDQQEKGQTCSKTEQEVVIYSQDQIDMFEEWTLKKEIEARLRKELLKEAYAALEEERSKIMQEQQKENLEKRCIHEEWYRKKEFEKNFKKSWEKKIKELEKLDKKQRQSGNKNAFQEWIQGHCQKLQQKQQEDALKKQIEKQKKEIAMQEALQRKAKAEEEFKKWKKQKAQQIRQSSQEGRRIRSQSQIAKSPSFNGPLNIMIRSDKKNRVSIYHDQGEYIQSPERYSHNKKMEYLSSPMLVEKRSSNAKKSHKKQKKKFSVNRNQMRQQKPYIDRISEEKSSEISLKSKKEVHEISSIQKHNQSQPADDNHTVENMIYGMEARQE